MKLRSLLAERVVQVAALQRLLLHLTRLERRIQCIVECLNPLAVVVTDIARVNVQRDGVQFRPGVYGQMRFRQHHRTGSTTSISELVKSLRHHGQTSKRACFQTGRFKQRCILQQ